MILLPQSSIDYVGMENALMEKSSKRFHNDLKDSARSLPYNDEDYVNLGKFIKYLDVLRFSWTISENFHSFARQNNYLDLEKIGSAYFYAFGIDMTTLSVEKIHEMGPVFNSHIEAIGMYRNYIASIVRHAVAAKTLSEEMATVIKKMHTELEKLGLRDESSWLQLAALEQCGLIASEGIAFGDLELNNNWISSEYKSLLSGFFGKVHEYLSGGFSSLSWNTVIGVKEKLPPFSIEWA